MDYGYQLLRHVVQQVFGNLVQAARLTLFLTLVPTILMLLTNPDLMTGQPIDPTTQVMPDINWGMLFLTLIASVVAWCWAAVAWHRYVLLEEYSDGFLPPWNGSRIATYFGRLILIGLIVGAVAVGIGIAIGVFMALVPVFGIAVILGIGLVIGVSWVATRLGLVLPAAAIGEPLKIGESWDATGPVSGQILLPIIVIAVVSGLAGQLVLVLFGTTVLAAVATALVSWLQLLVNLALMTTLYGNLIEGRALN